MLNPEKKYNLEYYLSVVDKIVAMGAHILGKYLFSILQTTFKLLTVWNRHQRHGRCDET
jgi:pyruvate carboxylase